jgi:non-heme chloroperoxidase
MPFYGYNKPDAKPSQGVRDMFWLQGMQSSVIASYECVKAFSETDLTEDLGKIEVPTLIIHGDADQRWSLDRTVHFRSQLFESGQSLGASVSNEVDIH